MCWNSIEGAAKPSKLTWMNVPCSTVKNTFCLWVHCLQGSVGEAVGKDVMGTPVKQGKNVAFLHMSDWAHGASSSRTESKKWSGQSHRPSAEAGWAISPSLPKHLWLTASCVQWEADNPIWVEEPVWSQVHLALHSVILDNLKYNS